MKAKTAAEYERWMRSTLYFAFWEGWLPLQRAGIIPEDATPEEEGSFLLPLDIDGAVRRKLEQLARRANNADMRRMSAEEATMANYAAVLLTAEALLEAPDVPAAAYHAYKLAEHQHDLGMLRAYPTVEPAKWLEKKAENAFQSSRAKRDRKEIPEPELRQAYAEYLARNGRHGAIANLAAHFDCDPRTLKSRLKEYGITG